MWFDSCVRKGGALNQALNTHHNMILCWIIPRANTLRVLNKFNKFLVCWFEWDRTDIYWYFKIKIIIKLISKDAIFYALRILFLDILCFIINCFYFIPGTCSSHSVKPSSDDNLLAYDYLLEYDHLLERGHLLLDLLVCYNVWSNQTISIHSETFISTLPFTNKKL